ncbi:MAG: hypothetical protein ACOH2H_13855 [Cypionkella sp.]
MSIWQDFKTLARSHPKALTGFILAAAVTLFFTVRIAVSVVYWSDPAHHHQPVQPWMTIGYVAKSWGLDPHDIDAAAGLARPQAGHPFTIAEIARKRGVAVAEIISLVDDTVARLRAKAPPK